MTTQDILLLMSLGIIVLWTTRLARSKGLNPWYWGVGTALLVVIAWMFSRQFLAPVVMAPLIFLLLFRSPIFRRNRPENSLPCPGCGAPDTGGLNFCVQCGWDLSRTAADQPDVMGQVESSPASPADQAWGQQGEAPVSELSELSEQDVPTPGTEEESQEDVVEAPSPPPSEPEPVLAQEPTPAPAPVEPPPQAAPVPKVPRPLPTPSNLTARGIELFNQGRLQESIDQFTKAIALDPNYREAWERRAEAYGRMGRPERQQADQRRLEAI